MRGPALGEAVLELAKVRKSFGVTPVLRGVTATIRRGEIHALLGGNGAGKTTLMRIVVGAESADAGEMTLAGAPYAPDGPRAARTSGVVMVPQERTLCPHLSVVENVVLGLEPAAFGFVRRREARALADRALALVGGERRIRLDERAGSLNIADQQLVEIARALAQGGAASEDGREAALAKVLVLDEPTSSLGRDDAERLFSRLEVLKRAGLAIVLVTHFLADVGAHSDRFSVLRDGEVVAGGDPKATSAAEIVHHLLGHDLEVAPPPAAEGTSATDVLLDVNAVRGLGGNLAVSFTLRRGEIFGIAGLVGSGRTALLRLVAGLDQRGHGTVHARTTKGIGLLSEDRGGEGLMLGRSIAENVMLSRRGPLLSLPWRLVAEGARWMSELGIKARSAEQLVSELSGGNQQKVQLARLLREDYDVLLVDEPTRGIDVSSKTQVLGLLRELARKGKGIVLVSSQLEELLSTCDRISVLRRGELGPSLPATSWTEPSLLLEASS